MKPFRLFFFAAFLLIAALHSGCVTSALTPQATELARVHDLYADEFAELAEPTAASTGTAPQPAPGDAFARSLSAIHDFRLRHPTAAQELAHLKVLEGMIYLQSGRFGLAEAVLPEITAARAQLRSSTGRPTRDALFADNFPHLLAGWKATRGDDNRTWQTFENAGNAIAASLREVQNLPPEQRANIEVDEGALYLASTAAVFYTWAAREIAMSHDRAQAPEKTRQWYQTARELIGGFLTPAERSATFDEDLSDDPKLAPPRGRLRYVDWYHWLNGQIGPAASTPPAST